MIEAIIEAIPWDKVGEVAIGVGSVIAGWLGAEVASRMLTGKGLFDHLLTLVDKLGQRLKSWLEKKRVERVWIKRLVFIVESCKTPVALVNKGMERVRIAVFGETKGGRRYNTGETVLIEEKKAVAEKLKSTHQMEAELEELNLV